MTPGPQPPKGSSPLSRGIQWADQDGELGPRIIPALAGNTVWSDIKSPFIRDHPRSRGEYSSIILPLSSVSGSSPLSRGIPPCFLQPSGCGRIIPALAGNTGCGVVFRHPDGDHPRSRGEYQYSDEMLEDFAGSSPLSRGIPRVGQPCRAQLRIIPALAGNTPGGWRRAG